MKSFLFESFLAFAIVIILILWFFWDVLPGRKVVCKILSFLSITGFLFALFFFFKIEHYHMTITSGAVGIVAAFIFWLQTSDDNFMKNFE